MITADAIKDYARAIGFDLVGIARTDPLRRDADRLRTWIAAGMHGEMSYMAEHADRAADPAQVVPGARSAVVVGISYRWSAEASIDGALHGRVSAYAWGTDYHYVMDRQLRQLADFLLDGGARIARYYVDTGPILDRAIAHRAGIGWFGKNTLLITKAGYGSYVFLGEIFTDLFLDPDAPQEGSCGRCQICLDRCPTKAIVAPYVVDARRCISYLTIELRGWIPRHLRSLIGTWVFGCDICQDVCPHNALVRQGVHTEFAPRHNVPFPDLLELLNLDEPTYQERFRHSAIKRAKRQGLRRNAAVALGNLRDARAVDQLIRTLDDPDPVIRGHVAWALGQIGGEKAHGALQGRHTRELDPLVTEELIEALRLLSLTSPP